MLSVKSESVVLIGPVCQDMGQLHSNSLGTIIIKTLLMD